MPHPQIRCCLSVLLPAFWVYPCFSVRLSKLREKDSTSDQQYSTIIEFRLPLLAAAAIVETVPFQKSTYRIEASSRPNYYHLRDLMVGFGLAVIADNLEAANHLANGEEAETLGGHDTTSNELDGTEVANLLYKVLGRLEDGAVLDRGPEVLVSGLEGSQGTIKKKRIVSPKGPGRCRIETLQEVAHRES